jgi:translation initiation factor 2B subunit (eIF-2B alpha/beta/delta family)|tara:strand:+ start:1255 stop:1650 length:396 start_codon:yes stop_codon:yes gene_type:complete
MHEKTDIILAEISAGELIDKITILEIKKEKIKNDEKLKDVEKELSSLNNTLIKSIPESFKIRSLIDKLKNINLKLWDIENGKRLSEKNNDFGDNFIALARNVYKENDERSKIKLEINNILRSNIKEVKSHY